jgi:hypothetical protein
MHTAFRVATASQTSFGVVHNQVFFTKKRSYVDTSVILFVCDLVSATKLFVGFS